MSQGQRRVDGSPSLAPTQRRALCVNHVWASKMFNTPEPQHKSWEVRNSVPAKVLQYGDIVDIAATGLGTRDAEGNATFSVLGSARYIGFQVLYDDDEVTSTFQFHQVPLEIVHNMQKKWAVGRKIPIALKFDSFVALDEPIEFTPKTGSGVFFSIWSPDPAVARRLVVQRHQDQPTAGAATSQSSSSTAQPSAAASASMPGTAGLDEPFTSDDESSSLHGVAAANDGSGSTSASSDGESKRAAHRRIRRGTAAADADDDSSGDAAIGDSDSDSDDATSMDSYRRSYLPLDPDLPGQRALTEYGFTRSAVDSRLEAELFADLSDAEPVTAGAVVVDQSDADARGNSDDREAWSCLFALSFAT